MRIRSTSGRENLLTPQYRLSYSVLALSLGLVGALIVPAYAQKSPQETIESISAADGFEVKLFAAEPMIVNPIAVDVDTHGRVWVTEGTKYRRNVGNPPDDKLKVRSEEHTSELQSPV